MVTYRTSHLTSFTSWKSQKLTQVTLQNYLPVHIGNISLNIASFKIKIPGLYFIIKNRNKSKHYEQLV